MAHLPAPAAENEASRLGALRRYEILDTGLEQGFEDLTRLASFICGTPISTVTFVDEHRQWFKSHRGLDVDETPRDQAFCAHAILQPDVFIVPDATLDERFSSNPLVTSEPNIRFYAGAPLVTSDGFGLGTLCVIDRVPRTLTGDQQEALRALGRRVMAQLELRKALGDLYAAYRELESLEQAKQDFVAMVGHQLRTPLRSIDLALTGVLDDPTVLTTAGHRQMVGDARATARRLTVLSNEVGDFSAAATGALPLRRRVCDVADLLAAAGNAPALAGPGHHPVEVHADEAAGMIVADGERMVEALVILLQLALTHSTGQVRIEARGAVDGVEITIAGDGPGLPPNAAARLFQPFADGAGLRRALAKAIVDQHGGSIRVASDAGDSLRLAITLPRR